MRILGGDTVVGDAFGEGASGLAGRRDGMSSAAKENKPVAFFCCLADTNLGFEPVSVAATLNPKIHAPGKFIVVIETTTNVWDIYDIVAPL